MNPNNRGIVLCFLIYLALSATIVSIIEMPWVVVPVGSSVNVNMSSLSINRSQAAFVRANVSDSTNLTWSATVPGYCGVRGFCYPFEDESVLVSLLSGSWGSRCEQMNPYKHLYEPLANLSKGENITTFHYDVVKHTPLYLTIAGSVVLLLTWIVSVCSCCNHDCGCCTIYSVLSLMLTFGVSVFLAGGIMMFLFANDDESCIQKLCGDVESAFDIGHCLPGWSLYIACSAILLGYLLALSACVIASKTPLASGKFDKIIEVRPAGPRHGGRMMTTRA